jgi:hypothetical protein
VRRRVVREEEGDLRGRLFARKVIREEEGNLFVKKIVREEGCL